MIALLVLACLAGFRELVVHDGLILSIGRLHPHLLALAAPERRPPAMLWRLSGSVARRLTGSFAKPFDLPTAELPCLPSRPFAQLPPPGLSASMAQWLSGSRAWSSPGKLCATLADRLMAGQRFLVPYV
jgi:hypothetical protein